MLKVLSFGAVITAVFFFSLIAVAKKEATGLKHFQEARIAKAFSQSRR